MNYVVGVDIGGTFTDCVVVDDSGTSDHRQGAVDACGFFSGALQCRGRCRQQPRAKRCRSIVERDAACFFMPAPSATIH